MLKTSEIFKKFYAWFDKEYGNMGVDHATRYRMKMAWSVSLEPSSRLVGKTKE